MRLIKDELYGFAKSKVMIVLWVILPILAIGGYFLFTYLASLQEPEPGEVQERTMSVSLFLSFLLAKDIQHSLRKSKGWSRMLSPASPLAQHQT
jgi:hypothetical protein